MNNPYSWNTVNPSVFYGRDAILSELLSGLPGSPRHSFGIAGARRIGKTTLLRRVEMELNQSLEQWRSGGLWVIPIYVDGLVLPRPLQEHHIWGYILSKLRSFFPEELLIGEEIIDFESFKARLKPVLVNLPERPRIIVLFDEIEHILINSWSDGFFAYWRALLGNTPGLDEYFTAVFAGAHEMTALRRDIGSPLKDILDWHNLGILDFEDTCRLMQEPIEKEWPIAFLHKVFQETGGHPMLLQYIMQKLYDSEDTIVLTTLENVVKEFELKRHWQFSEWWHRYCTPPAQRVYARLPDNGTSIPLRYLTDEFGLDEANDALEILEHVGLAVAEDDRFAFRYTGEMFRYWYRRYGRPLEAPMHDAQLYSRLSKLIGTELAGKYLNAWKIYQQKDLSNYSPVVGEMRDILTHLLKVIAPEDQVIAQPDFQLEPGQTRPTRRQAINYASRQLYSRKHTEEIISDYDLLEIADHLAEAATNAYRQASGSVHTIAGREKIYRMLKQWESILVQLLPEEGNS